MVQMFLPHTVQLRLLVFRLFLDNGKRFFGFGRRFLEIGLPYFFVWGGIAVRALEEKILREGKVYPGEILKVGNFLNQQIDTDFMMEMGKEIARLFAESGATKILTIEASGIALALAAGAAMHIPALFAKKSKSINVGNDVYTAHVHSYTHGTDHTIVVDREYLSANDRVLIVDDFLATGNALIGLIDLCKEAGAAVVGAAVAIEKEYQQGGNDLRASGLRVESLARIASMSDCGIEFVR